jgi:two-component system, OmpR family, sensor histidine kinase TctE
MKRVFSLRRKLIMTFLGLWLISVVLSTLAAYWFSGQAAQVSFDRILKDDALALAAQIRWTTGKTAFNLDPNTADLVIYDSSSPSQYAVFDKSLQRLSGDLDAQIDVDFSKLKLNEPNFLDVKNTLGDMRLVAMRINHEAGEFAWVVVAESNVKRNVISRELAAAIFLPALGLAFLVIPLLLFGIRLVLEPARTISEQVSRKGIEDLSVLQLDGVPEELQTLIGHLNDLLQRLREAIEHERRFIADAAHQLRTPIAGIKVLTQDLVRTHSNNPLAPPDAEVVNELNAAAIRATHLVQQLLSLARNELSKPLKEQRIHLSSVIHEIEHVWCKRFIDASKTCVFLFNEDLINHFNLSGNELMLSEALNNLFDNALKYGGDQIELKITGDSHQISICIRDNGDGVNSQQIDELLTPFWRGPDVSAGGVGLGLPIVAGAVRQLGGQLQILSRPEFEGFQVQLVFNSKVVDDALLSRF